MFGSKGNTDETGQASTLKVVGKFKGIIKVYNKEEQDKFKADRKSTNEEITRLIREAYLNKHKEAMAFDFDKLET